MSENWEAKEYQILLAKNAALQRENEKLKTALDAWAREHAELRQGWEITLGEMAEARAEAQTESISADQHADAAKSWKATAERLQAELAEARERLATRCECVFNEAEDEVVKWCALHAETRNDLAAARACVSNLQSMIGNIARVAGRGVPDSIDNAGQPYQSASLSAIIKAAGESHERT